MDEVVIGTGDLKVWRCEDGMYCEVMDGGNEGEAPILGSLIPAPLS